MIMVPNPASLFERLGRGVAVVLVPSATLNRTRTDSYDLNAAFKSLQRHEGGIHTLRSASR
jgi:hypothetical protein